MSNNTISVIIMPSSSKSDVEKLPDGTYRAHVKAPPEKGKANSELIKLIRKKFGKKAAIINGFRRRQKTLKLT